MSGTYEFPTGGDGELTPALRELYRAPEGEAYWAGLEARILAHAGIDVNAAPPAWWQVIGGWSRFGLAAAGIVALLAGAAAIRERQAELRDQYEIVLEAHSDFATPMTVAIPGPRDMRQREQHIRDLLEY
jgi:hypothetical protein